jgi:hypothetical protein
VCRENKGGEQLLTAAPKIKPTLIRCPTMEQLSRGDEPLGDAIVKTTGATL